MREALRRRAEHPTIIPVEISTDYALLRPSKLAEVLAPLVDEARQPVIVLGPPDAAKGQVPSRWSVPATAGT